MTSRRFLFVVVLVALVAGALVAGRASSSPAPTPSANNSVPPATVVKQSDTVWFCPGLPTSLPHRGGRVTFANVGTATADVVATDLTDKGDSTHVSFQVAAGTVITKARDQLGAPGALTIETFGGRVLVEEGVEGSRLFETTPCATQTSAHWYFAAGTTPRGVQQWLVIDNPYASDAKVDVTLRTSSGVLRPDALQSLDVPRRSRDVIAIHNLAVRQQRVAVQVDSAVGTVVAAQTLVYTSAAGTPGVALSLGSPAVGTDWNFVGATAQPSSTALVAIANVGDDDAQIDVQATAESSAPVLTPTSLTVAQDAVVWVALGHCSTASSKSCIPIPDGVRYSLDVRSEQNVSIVAQTLTRFAAPAITGTVTSPGGILAARSWAFARSRVNGETSTTASFFNPGADPAVVSIGLTHDGTTDHPAALQDVRVPPGRAVTVVVVGGRRPATRDAAMTIDSTEPILAERLIVVPGEAANAVGVVIG